MKLLLVEDDDLNRKLVRAVFRHTQHTTEEAVTAEEAIAALESAPAPGVVLLDINIPGGGLAVAAHIRATPELKHTTVIALTAAAMNGDKERFLAAGCHGYISKPIDVLVFVAQVEAIHAQRLGETQSGPARAG